MNTSSHWEFVKRVPQPPQKHLGDLQEALHHALDRFHEKEPHRFLGLACFWEEDFRALRAALGRMLFAARKLDWELAWEAAKEAAAHAAAWDSTTERLLTTLALCERRKE